jgi:CRP/FNR family cyclic AMP-dependent transcriptional regulator
MRARPSADLIAAVAASPLFAECNDRDIRALVRDSTETNVPAGWTLVHEQTPADACYLILDGDADVRAGGQVVATLTAGAVVGEVALAAHRLRNASATARTPLRLLHIDAGAFASLSPQLRTSLLRDVRQRDGASAAAPLA